MARRAVADVDGVGRCSNRNGGFGEARSNDGIWFGDIGEWKVGGAEAVRGQSVSSIGGSGLDWVVVDGGGADTDAAGLTLDLALFSWVAVGLVLDLRFPLSGALFLDLNKYKTHINIVIL